MTTDEQTNSEETLEGKVTALLSAYPGCAYAVLRDVTEFSLEELKDCAYKFLSDKKYTRSLAAASALASWGFLDDDVRTILEHALGLDPEPEFQVIAAAALGRARDARAVKKLESLREEGTFGISTLAYDTLCMIGHTDTIQRARAELHDPELALYGAPALARLGEADAIPILREKLKGGSYTEVRRSLEGLGYASDEDRSIGALIEEYCEDDDPTIRHAAYLALAHLAQPGSKEQEERLLSSWGTLTED